MKKSKPRDKKPYVKANKTSGRKGGNSKAYSDSGRVYDQSSGKSTGKDVIRTSGKGSTKPGAKRAARMPKEGFSGKKSNSGSHRSSYRKSRTDFRSILVYGRRPVKEIDLNHWSVQELLIAQDSGLSESDFPNLSGIKKIRKVNKEQLDQITEGGVHQGVAARVEMSGGVDIKRIVSEMPDMVVAVDRIQDTRNLGAIIRTAEAAGCGNVIYPIRRGAPITTATIKSSAGAAMRLPLCGVSSLYNALRELKKAGYTIVGCDSGGGEDYRDVELNAPVCIVVGSEEKGMSQLVSQLCDHILHIRMYGHVASLNASVAAGIVIYEVRHHIECGKN